MEKEKYLELNNWDTYYASLYKKEWLESYDDEAVLLYEQACLYNDKYDNPEQYNPEKAIKYFKMSAAMGYAPAMYEAGDLLLNAAEDLGVNYDEDAYKYTLKAIEVNYIPAYQTLAHFYENGIVVDMNLEKACEYYTICAERGESYSQFFLGIIYDEKLKQSKAAEYWYTKAIIHGNYLACLTLGQMYELGRGKGTIMYKDYETIEKNEYTAAQLYKKAVQEGIKGSYYRLASCYENGIGVEVNIGIAIQLYKKGIEEKDSWACLDLALLYGEGKEGVVKPNIQEAIRLFELGAEFGNDDCMYELGCLYLYGELDPDHEYPNLIDREKGVYWMQKAAELGNEEAAYGIENLEN